MRIGIDCRMLGPGFGLARYVEQLVKHLLEIDLKNEYVLFLKDDNFKNFSPLLGEGEGEVSDINNPHLTSPYKGEEKTIDDSFYFIKQGRVKLVLADIPWYSWAEQIKFKKIIDQEKVDLMHFPHWNVPLFYNKPFVVTIHDLIMYHFPRAEATTLGPLKFWLKDRAHRLLVKHAVKKAKHILITSEFTKQDIHQTLHVPMEKMIVTYQAPFEISNFQFSISNQTQSPNDKVLEKFKVSKPFVLYVGSAYPHKNLERLLKAWQIFTDKHDNDYQLVLVGKESYFYDRLKREVEGTQSIIFTGFVPDDELVELYKQASLYVFPSLYEGFGLPPLEAQKYNVPVVSSNASCLPEVLVDSALYFDPENPDQIADIIWTGLTDNNLRFELQNNAQENLQRFSWQKLAEQTLEVYKKLL